MSLSHGQHRGAIVIPLLLLVIVYLTGTSANLCQDYTSVSLADVVHRQSTPQGGTTAGGFLKDTGAHTIYECIQSCCVKDTCNYAFLVNETCFLIECNVTAPEACQPTPRKAARFEKTFMVEVRSIAETTAFRLMSTPDGAQFQTTPRSGEKSLLDRIGTPSLNDLVSNECTKETEYKDCGPHAKCDLEVQEDHIGFVCKCEKGYQPEPKTNLCTALSPMSTTRPADRSCTYGLMEDCFENEECVPNSVNSRSRQGSCHCVKGYVQNTTTGWCVKKESAAPVQGSSTTSNPIASSSTQQNQGSVTPSPLQESTLSPSGTSPTGKGPITLHPPSSTAAPSVKSTVQPLVVSAGNSREITLPENELTLSAYTTPKDEKGEYKYEWTLMTGPQESQDGQMIGINTATLKLSKLVAGVYLFKVAVSADGKYGEGFVNVTVSEPARENKPPVSVIRPSTQEVNQPNDAVLDGSESSDDDKIVKYHWEMASGVVGTQQISDEDASKPTVVMKTLAPGKYKFKLTVTDSDGASNSSFANVTVIKEKDYPPKANPGSNVIISLPQNSVTLYGNSSTDDKGIASYEWIKKSDDKLTADTTGVRTAVLHLENLEVGSYTFTLKVTDTAGQVDTADIHVFVRQEHNKPPVARVGPDKVVTLPADTVILDGSNSTDDSKIISYLWTQLSGPNTVTLENTDRGVATAKNLVKGEYIFNLLVMDEEKKQGNAKLKVTVKQDENQPPKADAGPDQIVTLPQNLVTIDGTKSSDDKAIVSYKWSRSEDSLAVGDIVNNSDHQAILQLTNLVEGRYMFSLEVTDAEGLSSKDSTSLFVKPDLNQKNLVELKLATELHSFTYANKKNVEKQLSLLLHRSTTEGETQINVQKLQEDQNSGSVALTFYATIVQKEVHRVQPGVEVVQRLKQKFRAEGDLLDIKVISVDTLVCQNNCSGHGVCNQYTKHCVCEAFWMENIVKSHLGNKESNCDWSILYVIIVVFVIVITLSALVWGIICFCKRWHKYRPRKRHRYTLLQAVDDESRNGIEMHKTKPGKGQGNNSIMVSESDFSSDEETLFIQHKKANGHLKNGLVKPQKGKVKT